MAKVDESIQCSTHWGAGDTLSRLAFFTVVSWQSWDTSLTLMKRKKKHEKKGSSQGSFDDISDFTEGELEQSFRTV